MSVQSVSHAGTAYGDRRKKKYVGLKQNSRNYKLLNTMQSF